MIKTRITLNQYLAAASLLVVFVIDIITPTEFVADILYLCCILLVFKESSRIIIGFSVVACLLIVVDVLLFDINLKFTLSHLINRVMSIVAISVTSYITVLYRNLNQVSVRKERQHLLALKEILFITSHRVRKPVANVLGLTEVISNDNMPLTAAELKNSYQYLLSSAKELDSIIKELNAFIEQTEHHNSTDSPVKPNKAPLTKLQRGSHSKSQVITLAVN